MSKVFVVDTHRQPVDPVHPGYARRLLSSGKAAVLKRYPFTIVLKMTVVEPQTQPLRIKLDPGSKTTGIAVVNDASGGVLFAAALQHRGQAMKEALDARRAIRRSRRQRKTRYRQPRWRNRQRVAGWIAPSVASRIEHMLTWVRRLSRSCPIRAISQELVRFDTQLMDTPDIAGVEYQQGSLFQYEVREYLLEQWQRRCAYCGKTDIPLEVEHIVPRAKGGTNRISNLTLACQPCNQAKGARTIEDFLQKKPALLTHIQAQTKHPLKDAAAVNSTRWALYERLKTLGMPVEVGSGGLTKYNRSVRHLPKTHWLDASCVGRSTPEQLQITQVQPLLIKARGHGSRRMCLPDRYGFPRTSAKGAKQVRGFQTGDIVKAIVTSGKKIGIYVGRVAVRATGSLNITTQQGTVQGISYRSCYLLHRVDGYSYQKGAPVSSPCLKAGVSTGDKR
ncbi:MAG TPA: RNA-guided endonuclease IscB [Dictyobacter sp.]|jgi:5-methylcytosine-specific restriction endonuclease McrA|nr:RNA-guided endonuclease IscB [Dictyobacter sp.]